MINRIEIAGTVLSIRMTHDASTLRLCITNPEEPGKKTFAFNIEVCVPARYMPDDTSPHNPLVGKGLRIVGQLRKPKDKDVRVFVTEKVVVLDRRKRSVKRPSAYERRLR